MTERREPSKGMRRTSRRLTSFACLETRSAPFGTTRDLAASFQHAVVRVLVKRTLTICRREAVRSLLITGGVACNERLRDAFREAAETEGLSVYIPAPAYTTDNAAMIAAAGFLHLERGERAALDLNPDAALKLGV